MDNTKTFTTGSNGETNVGKAEQVATLYRESHDSGEKRGRGRPPKGGKFSKKVGMDNNTENTNVQKPAQLVDPAVVKNFAKESAEALLATCDEVYKTHMETVGKSIKLTKEEIVEIASAGYLKPATKTGIAEQIGIIAVKYDIIGRFATEITLCVVLVAYAGGVVSSMNRMSKLVKEVKEAQKPIPKNEQAYASQSNVEIPLAV